MCASAVAVASTFNTTHGRGVVGEADMGALKEARAAALTAVGADVALVPDEMLQAMCRDTCQLGPVCAIVGGILAAEVIKAISVCCFS
jgi:ubiquitin-like 1-activating enzyme E1 A